MRITCCLETKLIIALTVVGQVSAGGLAAVGAGEGAPACVHGGQDDHLRARLAARLRRRLTLQATANVCAWFSVQIPGMPMSQHYVNGTNPGRGHSLSARRVTVRRVHEAPEHDEERAVRSSSLLLPKPNPDPVP